MAADLLFDSWAWDREDGAWLTIGDHRAAQAIAEWEASR